METLTQEDELIKAKYSLFSVVGVEVEYMIVDSKTLNILPLAEVPLKNKPERTFEGITWNNELAAHVIELKVTDPVKTFKGLDLLFFENVKEVQKELKSVGAKLLPGAIHPWMNPKLETKLWKHEGYEIYKEFHSIFDCYRHGWANLQSIHLNLPFATEDEFRKLHSCLRVLLPIIPAIAASSPFVEGKETGFLDYRLEVYAHNQEKFPIITGDVIPDVIISSKDLKKKVYDPIQEVVAPFNRSGILDPVWVNSRGIIPRFDRGSVEVRVIDSQESPVADMAISEAIFLTAKALCSNQFLESIPTENLVEIFKSCIKQGDDAMIDDMRYLQYFGLKKPVLAKEIWHKIYEEIIKGKSFYGETLSEIINRGPLAKRLLKAYKKTRSLKPIYEQLAQALERNQLF